MGFELEGVLDDFVEAVDSFSTTFTVTAEQFSSSFAKAFGLNDTNWKEETNKTSIHVIEKSQNESQAQLTPAICSCCGGRIGKDNYCEFCGTRYW